MKYLILAFMLVPLFCGAQSITITQPKKSVIFSASDPITPGERINLDSVVITGADVYLHKSYLTAKCKIIVKTCSSCPEYVVNCYRRENGYRRTFWNDPDCRFKKIYFGRSLIYVNWYDKNW